MVSHESAKRYERIWSGENNGRREGDANARPRPPPREGGTSFPSPHDIPAGHHAKPAIDCDGAETRDMAYGLLRVLNDEDAAVGDLLCEFELMMIV